MDLWYVNRPHVFGIISKVIVNGPRCFRIWWIFLFEADLLESLLCTVHHLDNGSCPPEQSDRVYWQLVDVFHANNFFFRFVYCVRYRPVNAYHKSSFNILHARTRLVLYDDGAEKLRFLPEPSLCITHDLERSRTWQSPGAFGLLPDVETRVLLFGCGLLEGPSSRTWPSQKGRLTNLTFP
jgi:hypothetical protein